ncbi:putative glycolipid-binding domain-containing protein [Aureimonas sp. SK2]|uniref:putative glycolipid-binding domain-containing protein n=1 Tax=Aureimonas sp. SK2 TaxID=3015992 RepID=UPI002443EC7C|nr:putative glycolipid-binding domain-containing protein [Aureimonas sp. SK2]
MRFQPLAPRDVRWTPVAGAGLEHLHLTTETGDILARSVVIGERDGRAFGATYAIRLDAAWHVRDVEVETVDGKRLALARSGAGRWTGADGTHRADLDGCIDIDLSATPFTNTLPIRRLDGRLDGAAALRMVYVPFDTLAPFVDEQRYTALSPRLFRYEAADGSFSAELPVDEDGLVIDYPTLFWRA